MISMKTALVILTHRIIAVSAGTYEVRWLVGVMLVNTGLSRNSNVWFVMIRDPSVSTSTIARGRVVSFTDGVVTYTLFSSVLLTKQCNTVNCNMTSTCATVAETVAVPATPAVVTGNALAFVVCLSLSQKRHWCCTLWLQRISTDFGSFWQRCFPESMISNGDLLSHLS